MVLLCVVGLLFVLLPVLVLLLTCRPKKDLKGWTVLITGAAQGLGKELAIHFASRGCRLILWDISPSVMDVAKGLSSEAVGVVVDVSDEESVAAAARQSRAFGEVDVLVNNAAIVSGQSALSEAPAQCAQVLQVNVLAASHTVRQFVPAMLQRNQGHVVTVSSVMAHFYACDLSSYCASKAALLAWHNCLRLELKRENKGGVHSTVVCPYAINTGMFKGCQFALQWLLPVLTTEAVAQAVVSAVEHNQPAVVLPWLMRLALPLQQLLPTELTDTLLVHLGGANHAMATFHGAKPPASPTAGGLKR